MLPRLPSASVLRQRWSGSSFCQLATRDQRHGQGTYGSASPRAGILKGLHVEALSRPGRPCRPPRDKHLPKGRRVCRAPGKPTAHADDGDGLDRTMAGGIRAPALVFAQHGPRGRGREEGLFAPRRGAARPRDGWSFSVGHALLLLLFHDPKIRFARHCLVGLEVLNRCKGKDFAYLHGGCASYMSSCRMRSYKRCSGS